VKRSSPGGCIPSHVRPRKSLRSRTSDLPDIRKFSQDKLDGLADGKLNRIVWSCDRRIGSSFDRNLSKETMLRSWSRIDHLKDRFVGDVRVDVWVSNAAEGNGRAQGINTHSCSLLNLEGCFLWLSKLVGYGYGYSVPALCTKISSTGYWNTTGPCVPQANQDEVEGVSAFTSRDRPARKSDTHFEKKNGF
jgi:hypothetical protein